MSEAEQERLDIAREGKPILRSWRTKGSPCLHDDIARLIGADPSTPTPTRKRGDVHPPISGDSPEFY